MEGNSSLSEVFENLGELETMMEAKDAKEAERIGKTAERNIRDEVARARTSLRREAVELAVELAESTLRKSVTQAGKSFRTGQMANATKTKAQAKVLTKRAGIVYRGITFPGYNKPIASNRKGKKKMVLVKKGGKVKLVHFGQKGYQDFTQHKDPKRRENYLKRSGLIR